MEPTFSNFEKTIIFIGELVNDIENTSYQKYLRLNGFNLYAYSDISEGIKKLKSIKFKLTYIIIQGSNFDKFVHELRCIENELYVSPRIIIFACLFPKEELYNYYINSSFYNIGGVAYYFSTILEFLEKKFCYVAPYNESIVQELNNDTDFTFQTVNKKEDLIAPVFLSELIHTPSDEECRKFDIYLMKNFGKDKIYKLIAQIYDISCPISIRIKYWLRAYTEESNFYKRMKIDLMKDNFINYLAYIKLLYQGLELGRLDISFTGKLYRGSVISNSEINNLISYKKDKSPDLPFSLVFCKTFLSFSKEMGVAKSFMSTPKNSQSKVLYILEKGNFIKDKKNFSNADLGKISAFENEKEILFFPFSIFEVSDVEKNYDYYIISLKYLGKYKELFKNEAKKELFDSIPETKFTIQLKNSGLSKIKKLSTNVDKISSNSSFSFCTFNYHNLLYPCDFNFGNSNKFSSFEDEVNSYIQDRVKNYKKYLIEDKNEREKNFFFPKFNLYEHSLTGIGGKNTPNIDIKNIFLIDDEFKSIDASNNDSSIEKKVDEYEKELKERMHKLDVIFKNIRNNMDKLKKESNYNKKIEYADDLINYIKKNDPGFFYDIEKGNPYYKQIVGIWNDLDILEKKWGLEMTKNEFEKISEKLRHISGLLLIYHWHDV